MSSHPYYIDLLTDKSLLTLFQKFHKNLENGPLLAVKSFQKLADQLNRSPDILVLEDCAEHLANYIKKSSVWKARAVGESLLPLPLPSRILILKHFTDFSQPGFSVDSLLSTQQLHLFGRDISVFRKSKMTQKALVFGKNNFGSLGVENLQNQKDVLSLTPLDFKFDEAFHSGSHTIFWRRLSGEVWACGKAQNYLKDIENNWNYEIFHSEPQKLDYVALTDKKEGALVHASPDYTIFENYTSERSLFIGNPMRMFKLIKTRNLEIWEQGSNWMVFSRKWNVLGDQKTVLNLRNEAGEVVKVECQNGVWRCRGSEEKGTIINFFCGKRVPKMRDLTICEDGSVWYQDKETLFKGSLSFSNHPTHGLQLISSMLEIPFFYRIGGFSVAPNGASFIIYPSTKNRHIEELSPRHQMDYSMFTLLTYDPWSTYFSDISTAIDKISDTEQWLGAKLTDCFNEYGFISDELETLTAINHLYDLIKIPSNQDLPDMMLSLIGWGTDKLAPLLIVQHYQRQVLETENLRITVAPSPPESKMSRIIQEAQLQYTQKLSVIRENLQILQNLQYPENHEGIWTYVKYVEFIGYYRNRSLGSKGRFESKPNFQQYFQTRDLERIVRRRVEQGNVEREELVLEELVKVQAIGHRSDKTKMDHFYMYPCTLHVFRTTLEAVDPQLLNHIDQNRFLDLNLVCHNDPDNSRFVRYIRELTGCDHPRDFDTYQSKISLSRLSESFADNYSVSTADQTLLVPKIIFRIFSTDNFQKFWDLERIQMPQVTGDFMKLAVEALLDVRELLRVSAEEKFKVYQLYCNLRFMEAAADIIKLIVVTGSESDVDVFRRIFLIHPLEISLNIAKFRPEILILWEKLPVPCPEMENLKKITDLIISKRYQKSPNGSRSLVMVDEPMFGLKMGEIWLKGNFCNNGGEEDSERDVQRKFRDYVREDENVLDFATA